MSATDELRRMLDERGVEWHPSVWDRSTETYWKTADGNGCLAVQGETKLRLSFADYLTPAQAVEATLGRGECHNISPKLGNDEFTCEECLARVYGAGGQWFDANWKYHKFNYCPNCGRKVVG